MTIAVADILTRLDDVLLDAERVRWPVAERLRWMQDAEREIAVAKPEGLTVTQILTVTPGNARQPLPMGVLRLVEIRRNVADDTPVLAANLQEMDIYRPGWMHEETSRQSIKHFIVDPRNQKDFYVWPKPKSTVQVEAIVLPQPELPTADGTLPLDSTLLPAVQAYVCYRAFEKDSEDTFNATRAQTYYQLFQSALGLSRQSDAETKPVAGSA